MFEQALQDTLARLMPAQFEDAIVSENIRARFFVATVMLFLLGTALLFVSWLFLHQGKIPLLEWLVTFVSLCIQGGSLYLFLAKAQLELASKTLLWAHFAMLAGLLLVSGGIHSPFLVLFVFMPVFSAFVINAKNCKQMLVAGLLILTGLSVLDGIGITLPMKITRDLNNLQWMLFVFGLLLLIAIFTSYEMTLTALKKALVNEKNRFLNFAEHDELTGLLSYRAFEKILDANFHRHIPFALFYIDIDNFKQINHQYGHAMGDRVLQQIAARISNAIRNDDIVARVHSDEFALIINDINDTTDLVDIARTLKQSIGNRIDVADNQEIHVNCSIGYYDTLSGVSAKSTLISIAKSRMHHA